MFSPDYVPPLYIVSVVCRFFPDKLRNEPNGRLPTSQVRGSRAWEYIQPEIIQSFQHSGTYNRLAHTSYVQTIRCDAIVHYCVTSSWCPNHRALLVQMEVNYPQTRFWYGSDAKVWWHCSLLYASFWPNWGCWLAIAGDCTYYTYIHLSTSVRSRSFIAQKSSYWW